MLAKTLFAATALSTTFALTAIGCSAKSEGDSTTLDDALVSQDYDLAVRNLASLPYLPWAYTIDGCYARALYYSMLLSSKGVPTNHVYVVARPGTQLGGQWRWHVAPLVTKDSDPDHLYVLDPVYDQTRALTNVEWVAKQNFPDPNAANYPRLHVHSGNSYLEQDYIDEPLVNPGAPTVANYKEPAISEMPKFAMEDVSAACSVMHRYLDLESTTSPSEKAAKHVSLGRETQRIVGKLADQGKINGNPTLSASCTRNSAVGNAPDPSTSSEPFVDPSRIEPAHNQ